ncbi:VanW family protein [Candidatus Uhrbacteria bacterium]|nr:VanW family protein [Candidatus Uhrbacteria bacterium]
MPLSFLPPRRQFRWRQMTAIFFVVLIVAISLGEWAYAQRWQARIMPGVAIGTVALGGKTEDEARTLLDQTIDTLMRAGLPFVYQSKRVTVSAIVSAEGDLDITYPLVHWNSDAMVARALGIGHTGGRMRQWYEQTRAFFLGTWIDADVTLEKELLTDALRQNFSAMEMPATNATITIANGVIAINPESVGKVFDYGEATSNLEQALRGLAVQPIALALVTDYPSVKKEHVETLRPELETLLTLGPIQFIQGNRWWRVHSEVWNTWLTVAVTNGAPRIAIDPVKVADALAPIAEEINRPARDAKFVRRDGRIAEFQTAEEGKKLSVPKTVERIVANVLRDHATTVAVAVDTLLPALTDQAAGNSGIVDLLGTGKSNFAGSPTNRRHNIAVGAKALDGILIPAGETFSLLKALGEIDGEHGYKPELVIKGNRTIPEFGGGLCQIGTTVFRAALASGLPVVERQSHSYSVPYYLENGKPGVDATIYNPKPDFKFVNDTGSAILIQTRIKGDELIFEFWGKKDGRIASHTEPKVTNIQKPPPTKIVETEDLPVGVKKCTERAHTGATAEFTYTVTMTNGEKREKVFRSVYRPWQEVCLVGKEKSVTPLPNDASTTTLPSTDAAGVRGE